MTICRNCKHALEPWGALRDDEYAVEWGCKANPLPTNVVTGFVDYQRCVYVNNGNCASFEQKPEPATPMGRVAIIEPEPKPTLIQKIKSLF